MTLFKIKNLGILNIHPILSEIAVYVKETYELGTITSAYRPGDQGVHGTVLLRGIDLRCWSIANGKKVADDINKQWIYDPERPHLKVAIYHNVGSGVHLHLQVHRNTVRKDNGGIEGD